MRLVHEQVIFIQYTFIAKHFRSQCVCPYIEFHLFSWNNKQKIISYLMELDFWYLLSMEVYCIHMNPHTLLIV